MSQPESRTHEEFLTIGEVAVELRCSKAHVYKFTLGQVDGVEPLPSIPLGRRKLVWLSALEQWKQPPIFIALVKDARMRESAGLYCFEVDTILELG